MTKRTVFGTNFKAIITFLVETSRRRTTACRHLGTTTFAVYQAKSQGVIPKSADKWQTERLPH